MIFLILFLVVIAVSWYFWSADIFSKIKNMLGFSIFNQTNETPMDIPKNMMNDMMGDVTRTTTTDNENNKNTESTKQNSSIMGGVSNMNPMNFMGMFTK